MAMTEGLEIKDVRLSSAKEREKARRFLEASGLRFEPGIEYMAAVCGSDGEMLGCGALEGDTVKCVAISPLLQGEGIAASLVSVLLSRAFREGHSNVRVFTKPECRSLFESLGFSVCGSSPKAVLLESDSAGLRRYRSYLSGHKADGAIVMNANPFTLGHLYLIEKAAGMCRRLAVIPVGENSSEGFTYTERLSMLRDATRHIPGVEILEGSRYAVSPATFPSYFIKKADDAAEAQARLDLDIFCSRLAPELGTECRFVGTEPSDRLTALYNRVMKEVLPQRGIMVTEIERLEKDGSPVSASRVRHLLENDRLKDALRLVPRSDIPALLAFLACRALRMELDLAPKPGLVDPLDSGSHTDMDYAMMSRSIEALRPWFLDLARKAYAGELASGEELRAAGLEGERAMMDATGGVNTHKGAVFSLGIVVAASARILAGRSSSGLQEEIASAARAVAAAPPAGPCRTHGEEMRIRYGIGGAARHAAAGFPMLFSDWLPFLKKNPDSDETRLRLLLRIISVLDDTNAYYRAGEAKAREAMARAAEVAECFSADALRRLGKEFKEAGISHGGAADMLALTFFIRSLGIE